MQTFRRADRRTDEPERQEGWRLSGRPAGLGVLPWVFAIGVVAALGVGLHFLYN